MSRRARPDKQAFLLYKDVDGKIKEGTTIWIEYRCPNAVIEGVKVCPDCAKKLPKYKYQATQKCDHGMVNGPYPEDSKLYGSPYFLKKIKDGWKVKEDDERRAKEAATLAGSTMPRKQPEPKATEPKATEPKATEPKATSPSVEKPKVPRKPRVAKKAEVVSATPELPSQPAKFVESPELPIKVTDVIIAKVKKIKCEGKEYYLDSQSGKLYRVSVNGAGPYAGRYDAISEKVNTAFPDSDDE
jgi:hypothetical protein